MGNRGSNGTSKRKSLRAEGVYDSALEAQKQARDSADAAELALGRARRTLEEYILFSKPD